MAGCGVGLDDDALDLFMLNAALDSREFDTVLVWTWSHVSRQFKGIYEVMQMLSDCSVEVVPATQSLRFALRKEVSRFDPACG